MALNQRNGCDALNRTLIVANGTEWFWINLLSFGMRASFSRIQGAACQIEMRCSPFPLRGGSATGACHHPAHLRMVNGIAHGLHALDQPGVTHGQADRLGQHQQGIQVAVG